MVARFNTLAHSAEDMVFMVIDKIHGHVPTL